MSNKAKIAVVSAAVVQLLFMSSVNAQALPGGATPGGALPDLTEQRRPVTPQEEAVVVRPLIERLEQDVDEGPKIDVSHFHLLANRRAESAWRGGEYIAEVEAVLANAVSNQPSGGFTLGQIQEITVEIQNKLRLDGMMLAQVFLPEQTITDNIVWIHIMEGKMGRVVTEGNGRYKDTLLKRPLEPLAGGAVDKKSVEEAVLMLRDYPGIAVAGVFSPGETLGTTNLTLSVHDEDPFSAQISADNHGSEFTGENRLLASAHLNNLLGLADRITLSALQTYSPENGTYGSVAYTSPVLSPTTHLHVSYVQNVFDVGGGSQINATNIEGDTQIAQVGVSKILERGRERNITASVNLFSKRATVEESSSGIVQAEDKLSVLDFGVQYDSVDKRFRGLNRASVGFSTGLSDFLGSLPDSTVGENLGSSRVNSAGTSAGSDFVKWYGQFTRLQSLTEHSEILVRTNVQFSDDLLVSLEQFSLGGPNSVRAYPPAEFLVDSGGYASVEWILAAPGFADKSAFGGFNWGDVLRLSVFFDYAGGYLSDPAFGEQKTRDISGYGLGVDFRLPGTFWMRLDVAKPNSGLDPSDGDDPQVYFSFNYSF